MKIGLTLSAMVLLESVLAINGHLASHSSDTHTDTRKFIRRELSQVDVSDPVPIAAPDDAKWNFSRMEKKELLEMLAGWYRAYSADLEKLRAKARTWKGVPQSDDIEMAISYLRLRATKPSSVWECAPANGWSSLFILQALEDNGNGHLYSFGLEAEGEVFGLMNKCCPDLPKRWSYRMGRLEEFTKNYDFEKGKGGFNDSKGYVEVPLPQYVYFDALHTYDFGHMYASEVISKLKGHVHVSMHDAFRWGWSFSDAREKKWLSEHPHLPMPEAQGVIDTLGNKICKGFTISRSYSLELHESVRSVFEQYVHSPLLVNFSDKLNPTFWFELDGKPCAAQ